MRNLNPSHFKRGFFTGLSRFATPDLRRGVFLGSESVNSSAITPCLKRSFFTDLRRGFFLGSGLTPCHVRRFSTDPEKMKTVLGEDISLKALFNVLIFTNLVRLSKLSPVGFSVSCATKVDAIRAKIALLAGTKMIRPVHDDTSASTMLALLIGPSFYTLAKYVLSLGFGAIALTKFGSYFGLIWFVDSTVRELNELKEKHVKTELGVLDLTQKVEENSKSRELLDLGQIVSELACKLQDFGKVLQSSKTQEDVLDLAQKVAHNVEENSKSLQQLLDLGQIVSELACKLQDFGKLLATTEEELSEIGARVHDLEILYNLVPYLLDSVLFVKNMKSSENTKELELEVLYILMPYLIESLNSVIEKRKSSK